MIEYPRDVVDDYIGPPIFDDLFFVHCMLLLHTLASFGRSGRSGHLSAF